MDEIEKIRQSLEGLLSLRDKLSMQLEQVEGNIVSLENLLKTFEASVSIADGGMPDGSWTQKVLFMLKLFGEMTPSQLAEKLKTYEKMGNGEMYRSSHYLNIASQYLPNLYKEGLLEREKVGRAFIYKLKDKK